MLERKIEQTPALGQGYLICDPNTTYKPGTWVFLDGAVTAAQAGTTLTPGKAYSGAQRWTLMTAALTTGAATSYTSAGKTSVIGIMDKKLFARDGADLTASLISSGQGVNVYIDGWFETDQYAMGVEAAAIGAALYLTSAGILTTGVTGYPVARYWGAKSHTTFDSNYCATGMAYIQIIPASIRMDVRQAGIALA